jgi:hypothetical protein
MEVSGLSSPHYATLWHARNPGASHDHVKLTRFPFRPRGGSVLHSNVFPATWHAFREAWPRMAVGGVVIAILLLYLSTLQTDISGSHSEYTVDTGEFQIALDQWGTTHPTGYPLYSLLGSAFVSVVKLTGAGSASGASLFSLAWGLATIILVLAIQREIGAGAIAGIATALVLAAGHSFWVHSVISEVYSLTLFLVAAAFWLALRVRRQPEHLPWLGLILGLAVGLHRSALLIFPGVFLVLIWVPEFRRLSFRTLLVTALVFAGTFLVYLYLPIRAWQGASWLYGDPGSWDGFREIVFAREYSDIMKPERDVGLLRQNLQKSLEVLAAETPVPLLITGWIGLIVALFLDRWRWLAAGLIVTATAFIAFTAAYPRAVFLPAVLLPSLLSTAIGVGLLLASIGRWRRELALAGFVAVTFATVSLMVENRPRVLEYSHHPGGRELIDSVARLDDPDPIIVAPWGTDYFALAFGQMVTGEIARARLISTTDDLNIWLDQSKPLYVSSALFHLFRPPWWEERWGRLCLTSAEWRLIAIQRPPCHSPTPGSDVVATMGDKIALLSPVTRFEADVHRVHVTLFWRVLQPPGTDYSVFVHLTDRQTIESPDDLLAQQDSGHPIYGWYPTSRWQPGEVFREDYVVNWPPGRTPSRAVVGMYRHDPATNRFDNLGDYAFDLVAPTEGRSAD